MMLLYHSMRKKKRPERVVEDADPATGCGAENGRGKPLPYGFSYGTEKESVRFVYRPYVGLAEFARQGKSIQIRFSGDMCGGKTP